jgi:hypothetical protein
MKNTLITMSLVTLTALMSSPLLAQSLPQLSGTAGSGSAESYLVLDFENGTATTPDDSYAFGYLYNPTAQPDGFTMVQALANAKIGFSYTSTSYSFGDAIDSFSYHGLTEGGFQSSGYWSYYTTASDPVFTQADSSAVGMDDRTLSDGSYDGWAYDTGANPVPVTPMAVSTAVPEANASWLLLLGLPLILVAARRRAR